MWAATNTTDWVKALPAILGYGLVLYRTIRRNRNNRPVVLGVWTAVMFGGFLAVATLDRHVVLQAVLTVATILLGIAALFFAGRDVVRWLRGAERSETNKEAETPESGAP